jgi:hypothetical protein
LVTSASIFSEVKVIAVVPLVAFTVVPKFWVRNGKRKITAALPKITRVDVVPKKLSFSPGERNPFPLLHFFASASFDCTDKVELVDEATASARSSE